MARAKSRSEDFDLVAKTQSVQIVSKLQHFLPEGVYDVTIAADQTVVIPASTHTQDLGQASPDISVPYQQGKGVVDVTSDGESTSERRSLRKSFREDYAESDVIITNDFSAFKAKADNLGTEVQALLAIWKLPQVMSEAEWKEKLEKAHSDFRDSVVAVKKRQLEYQTVLH
ncbi:MAG: hypothetical protein Q9164_000910 [Protoblastenia rupestris]